jgi:RNA polymerase sigma-70 factor (ECF subfamily)
VRISPESIAAHLPALRRYARVLVRDAARADDLVQDCLERALSRWRLWRPSGEARAWLFTIMHNLHANQVRATVRRGPTVPLEAAPELASLPDQFDRVAAGQVLVRLAGLPPEQRGALALVVLEDFSYAEVARIQGVPIGTVMSRLSRARAALRDETSEAPVLRRVK